MKIKTFGTLLFTGLLLSLCACKKDMSVKVTDITGPLSGAYQLDGTEFPVVEDGDGYKVSIKLKRTDESVPFTNEGVGVISSKNSAMVVAGFGYDGGSDFIVKPEDCDGDIDSQKQILTLANGASGELVFKFKKDDVPETIKLTTALELVSSGKVTFDGAIGKYGVKNFNLTFDFKNSTLKGQYQYKTSPAGAFLDLEGKIADMENENGNYEWDIAITEYGDYGDVSALFKGDLELKRDSKDSPYYYVMTGDFVNTHKGLNFKYNLKSQGLGE